MTRVLLSSEGFWPHIGGVEVLAAKLVDALSARGHEFSVVAQSDESLPDEASYRGTTIRRLPFLEAATGRDPGLTLRVRKGFAEVKRAFRPDVVHIYHANFNSLFHLMTIAAHPAPTLVTVHGEFPDNVMAPDGIIQPLLVSSAWVTACSATSLARTRRQVPEIVPRSSLIMNALEPPPVAPAPLTFDPPLLVCVGRLRTNEKGFDLAIAAMPAILERYPRARLLIAGDGPVRAELAQQIADMRLGAHVERLGWIHPDKIAAFMNEATLVLMPSRVPEGFGLVALQAAQMGRPVVATRVGGVPEVVLDGETGVLVESEDVAGLARAVVSLLDDPARAQRLGRAAATRAASPMFGWTAHVDAYDTLLRSLTGKSPLPVGT
jgi:glycogen synthase